MMPPKYNLRFNLWQIKKALVQADGESLLLVSKDVIKVNPNFSFLCDISEIEQAALEDINSIAELKHLLSLFRGDFLKTAVCTIARTFWSISSSAGTIWKTESWWSITA